MIDPESRLDSVLLLEEGLSFYYTLPNKEKDAIPSGPFTAYILPGIVDNIQTNPRMEMFRDSSVVMLFRYLDRNGELSVIFSSTPSLILYDRPTVHLHAGYTGYHRPPQGVRNADHSLP